MTTVASDLNASQNTTKLCFSCSNESMVLARFQVTDALKKAPVTKENENLFK